MDGKCGSTAPLARQEIKGRGNCMSTVTAEVVLTLSQDTAMMSNTYAGLTFHLGHTVGVVSKGGWRKKDRTDH